MGNGFGIFEKKEERISLNKGVGCVPVGGFGWYRRASVKKERKKYWVRE